MTRFEAGHIFCEGTAPSRVAEDVRQEALPLHSGGWIRAQEDADGLLRVGISVVEEALLAQQGRQLSEALRYLPQTRIYSRSLNIVSMASA